jgi:preprotein translocase subunit SecE
MAEEKNLQAEEVVSAEATAEKAPKAEKNKGEKKENFFVRFGKKIKKLCRDLVSEMKKVVWLSKKETVRNSVLVTVVVVVTAVVIGLVDAGFTYAIKALGSIY